MNNKLIKNNFFQSYFGNWKKTFLIDANDNIQLDEENSITTKSGIYFNLIIKKNRKDLILEIMLYAWNNETNGYIPLEYSIWNEKEFDDGKYIPLIEEYYEKIVKNFLNIFKQLEFHWQLNEWIYRLENLTFIFHHKLLSLFSQKELENIMVKHFYNYPKLNIPLLKNQVYNDDVPYVILNNYIDSFFIDEIKVSVNFDDNKFAIFEDTLNQNTILSKKEFLKKISKARVILNKHN